MKRKTLLVALSIIFLLPMSLDAQVGRLLKKKLQEATKTAADEKADEKKDNARPGKTLMGLLGGGEASYDQSYRFTGRIILEMTVYDEEGNEDSVIDYHSFFSEETGNSAIEVKPVSGEAAQSGMSVMNMIFDQKNKSAIVLTSQGEQKTAIVTSVDIDEVIEDENIEESDLPQYSKTGKKRTISGYKCEEYQYTEDNTTMSMWVTDDLEYKVDSKKMKEAGMPVWYGGQNGMGMMIEMESFEDGKLTMKMQVKDIDMKYSQSFSLDGYTVMNLGEN